MTPRCRQRAQLCRPSGRMLIRAAEERDRPAIASIIVPTIRAGDTLALPREMSEEDALYSWTGGDREVFVAEEHGRVLGTYYIRPNYPGGGAHVANCGYATDPAARGKGVARRM